MSLILVTGASTGLGLAAAEALLNAGHEVVVHGRSADRFEDLGMLEQAHDIVYGDLADLPQTIGLAEQLAAMGRFDAVIHNAGVYESPDVLAVNVVAPYVLTAAMELPRRIIVLSSSLHRGGSSDVGAIDFSQPARGRRSYDDSKLQVTAFSMALADRYPAVLSHAVDPGWVPTRMGGAGATDDLAEGSATQVWLASADESAIEPRSGGYWYHGVPQKAHTATRDPAFQRTLIERLRGHTGLALPDPSA